MMKFLKGNEAVVVGALYAGSEVYFGYPITPASEIAHAAAEWYPAVGRAFLQAECETAAISMLYGAACAGKPAITATSGPGMSLMQEGLSYMAAAELPGVIVNIMRSGPGLGNIFPEQSDYNQAVKGGGHGNYKCLVFAPGSVQEMCDLTIKAFELSFKYRTPAIILADGLLGQMMESITLPVNTYQPPDVSDWAVQGTAETRGNLITSIFMNAEIQEQRNLHLKAKYESMRKDVLSECYCCDDADIILAAYGISSRISRSAVDLLRAEGFKAGMFRPITLSPFPSEQLCSVILNRKVLVVEHSDSQFCDDLRMHIAKQGQRYQELALIFHMGGVMITVEELIARVKKELGS
ncbi:MAG: 3-methyl-2-oxobutanoate dehydrogenase subunit VorB [Kiritimatiellae bacterium]|nr:3-methyl-2-oxobutanoate dehydrogenase subunit VorB [Kiritimatiellia bacterium]